jgi:hypothetical protein
MTLATFLALFQLLGEHDLSSLSSSAIAVIERLPREAEVYDAIAEETFRTVVIDDDSRDDGTFRRVETLFRILLYYDGRSAAGCLRLVQLAHGNQCSEHGVNSLGALANYFRAHEPLPFPRERMTEIIDAFVGDEELAHNAGECLRFLRRYGERE